MNPHRVGTIFYRPKNRVDLRKRSLRIGAGGGTRTLKLFRARAPKTRAVANFATPACPAILLLRSLINVSVAPRTLAVKGAKGCDPQKSSTPYSASLLLA